MQNIMPKLREAKEVKHLSYQDIADITEENGEAVSLATIKRFFAKESDQTTFRYNQTTRPIIRAVLGMDEATEEPTADPKQAEEYYATIEAMKAVIDYKHQQLTEKAEEVDRLKAELCALKESHQKQLDAITEAERIKIAHLKEQIAYLRSVNDRNAKVIERLLEK